MKPVSAWNMTPYISPMLSARADRPYICRILPYTTTLDFDFIDNAVLENGVVEKGKLVFNARKYSTLILPYCEVLQEETAQKLLKLTEQGISLICVGKVPCISRETGLSSAVFKDLQTAVDSGKIQFIKQEDIQSLGQVLNSEKFSLCVGEETRFERILTHRRKVDENTFLMMVANIGNDKFQGEIKLDNDYEICCFNACNGKVLECGKTNKISVSLDNGEALVYSFVKREV